MTDGAKHAQRLSVVDHYYKKYLVDRVCKSDLTDAQQYVLTLPNRVCVIGLNKDHNCITHGISAVDFRISDKTDRSQIRLSGKSKHGAQVLKPSDVLCYVTCDDGSKFPIYACVSGKLLEVNEKLKTTPQLLADEPETRGFVALVLPSTKGEFESCLRRYDVAGGARRDMSIEPSCASDQV